MRHVLIVVTSLVLAGCGSSSFLGRRYDNFTAHYNTYYNAKRAYDKAEEASRKQADAIVKDEFVRVFYRPEKASPSRELESAIKKGADILRKHPDSKWVDDALMLIGKSYYLSSNFVGAEQKFREVIELGSKHSDEARFRLALAQLAGGATLAADEHIRASIEDERVRKKWKARLHVAMAELLVETDKLEEAVDHLEAGVADIKDRQEAARAQYMLGQVLETLGRMDEAIAAYGGVRDHKPEYELSYAAQYSQLRAMGLFGDADEALRLLRKMRRDGKHYANRHEIDLLKGEVLLAAGRYDESYDALIELLYGSENLGFVRPRAHYVLASLYRDGYEDFEIASAHFDSAATVLERGRADRSAGSDRTPPPGAITDAGKVAEAFGSFATAINRVERLDSLIYLGSLDDEAFAARVQQIAEQRAAEEAERKREQERQRIRQGFRGGTERDLVAGRSGVNDYGQLAGGSGQSGFLFHRDPIMVQENQASFAERWGRRPLVPNWRRNDAILAAGGGAGGPAGPGLAGPDEASVDPDLPKVSIDVSEVPRTDRTRAAMREQRALARYEIGNVLFLAVDRPDSAASWYRLVIEEDSQERVAERAYYALSEVQRALGDDDSADRILNEMRSRFPESGLSVEAEDEGNGVSPEGADSLASAERAYDAAFGVWDSGDLSGALDLMLEVRTSYPTTPVAPRALLAAGTIYQQMAEQEGFDPIEAARVELRPPVSAGADSTQAAPSSGTELSAVVDTAAVVPVEPPVARVDSYGARDDRPNLRDLYAALVSDYPDSPHAGQARTLLGYIDEQLAPPVADTGAEADDTAAPDSAQAPRDGLEVNRTEPEGSVAQTRESRRRLMAAERTGSNENRGDAEADIGISVSTGGADAALADSSSGQDSLAAGTGETFIEDVPPESDGDDPVALVERDRLNTDAAAPDPSSVEASTDVDAATAGPDQPVEVRERWAVLTGRAPTYRAAEALAAAMARRTEMEASIIRPADRSESDYRVIVGDYASNEAARNAFEELSKLLPKDARVIDVTGVGAEHQPVVVSVPADWTASVPGGSGDSLGTRGVGAGPGTQATEDAAATEVPVADADPRSEPQPMDEVRSEPQNDDQADPELEAVASTDPGASPPEGTGGQRSAADESSDGVGQSGNENAVEVVVDDGRWTGWTIVTGSETDLDIALSKGRQIPRDVVEAVGAPTIMATTVEGVSRYRIIVGRFETSGDATRARRNLDRFLPSDAWVLRHSGP